MLDLVKKTLTEAASDLIAPREAIIVPRTTTPTQIFIGSIPIYIGGVEEVNMTSYAEEVPSKASKVKIIRTVKSRQIKGTKLLMKLSEGRQRKRLPPKQEVQLRIL